MNLRAIILAVALGTVFQVAMVVIGHSNPAIANRFALIGSGLSFGAGVACTLLAATGSGWSLAVGGLIAGGVCGLIGIFVSFLLGDVPAAVLLFGTFGSIVAGALGGFVARFLL